MHLCAHGRNNGNRGGRQLPEATPGYVSRYTCWWMCGAQHVNGGRPQAGGVVMLLCGVWPLRSVAVRFWPAPFGAEQKGLLIFVRYGSVSGSSLLVRVLGV